MFYFSIKRNSTITNRYESISIYHILLTGELFNPSDVSKVETIEELQAFMICKISKSTPTIEIMPFYFIL